MVWMRCSSGLKVTWGFSLFLLPLGRPGLPFGAFCCRCCVFLWLLACVATFSASVRTICSTMVGYERRCWVLINDKVKKDSPGTGLPYKDEKSGPTHRSSSRTWLPHTHHHRGGTHRLDGTNASERTPKTPSPRGSPCKRSAGLCDSCRLCRPNGKGLTSSRVRSWPTWLR